MHAAPSSRVGDVRYRWPLERIRTASDRGEAIHRLTDEEVVQALAAFSEAGEGDPYLANVLATEAMNRVHRSGVLARNAGEALVSLDRLGLVTDANPATARALRTPRRDLLGAHYQQNLRLVDEDGGPLPMDRCPIQQVIDTGVAVVGREARMRRRDDEVFDVLISVAPVMREERRDGAVVLFIDITERKLAEQAAAAERRRLYQVLEHLSEGVILLGPEGRVEFANRAAQRLYGRSLHELRQGAAAYAIHDLEGLPLPPEKWPGLRALRERQPVRGVRLAVVRAEGSSVVVEVDAMPIFDSGGRILGAALSFDDVTTRLEAERRLIDSEEIYRSLFENDPAAVFTIDGSGDITALNPRAEAIIGYSWQELRGQSFAPLLREEDVERAFVNFARVLEGDPRVDDYTLVRKDGTPIRVRVTGIPVRIGGRVVGMHGRAEPLET